MLQVILKTKKVDRGNDEYMVKEMDWSQILETDRRNF